MSLKILAALPLSQDQRRMIEGCGDVEILEVPPQPDPGLLEGLAAQTEVWYGPRLRPNLLERAPNLRWIQLISAGVDRYLFPELVDSEIVLTNVRGMHAATIADHVFAMILAFARDIPHFLRVQQDGGWDRREVRSVDGTKMAVVGLGGIGREVARRGRAFGMRVVGVARTHRESPEVERLYRPGQLIEAIADTDWVVLACPLTKQTFHLIGEEELGAMGPRSVVVNIGRGKLVDEAALVKALESGTIAGAGLDVFEEEPLPANSPLWGMSNVIITPHVAGSLQDYMDRATEIFCENLRRYLAGEPLTRVVDKKAGY